MSTPTIVVQPVTPTVIASAAGAQGPQGTPGISGLARTGVKTANYTAAAGDLVPVDTTSQAVTVTLPNAPADKTQVAVELVTQGGANAATVACAGTDVFTKTGGPTTLTLSLGQLAWFEYTTVGGIWTQLAGPQPSSSSAAYSRQIPIAANGTASTVTPPVGTWTPTFLTNADTGNFVGWVNVSDGAQSDSISFDFACGAGTYEIDLYHLPFQNRGIYTVRIDGTSVGTIDGYAASLSPARGSITGVALTAGAHVITLLMATKNASSSGFLGMVERLLLTRTA